MSRSFGAHPGHVAVADADPPAVDGLEAGQHPQRRGLAAAGRADEDEELAVGDLEVDPGYGGPVGAAVPALCPFERDARHR